MDDMIAALSLENGKRRYEDLFGLGGLRADDLDRLELSEEAFHAFMNALRAVSPAPIYYVDIPDGRNGCYGHAENVIYVSWLISPAMCIRTALHETAHALLHPWPGGVRPENEPPRAVRETEAEGIARLVCLNYGLDVSAYSADYIQSWIRHLSADEARRSQETIRRTAAELVAAIDAELEKQAGREREPEGTEPKERIWKT